MVKSLLIVALLSTPAHGAQETMVAHIRFQDTASIHREKGKIEMQHPPRQAAHIRREKREIRVVYE